MRQIKVYSTKIGKTCNERGSCLAFGNLSLNIAILEQSELEFSIFPYYIYIALRLENERQPWGTGTKDQISGASSLCSCSIAKAVMSLVHEWYNASGGAGSS